MSKDEVDSDLLDRCTYFCFAVIEHRLSPDSVEEPVLADFLKGVSTGESEKE
jgi:hypothetical protein